MPKPIQSQAAGLLGVLTSKDGGIGPAAAEDNLRLNYRTNDFYGLNFRQNLFRSQTAAQLDNAVTGWIGAGGAFTRQGWFPTMSVTGPQPPTDVFVPEGEIWRVLGVTFKFNRDVGTFDSLAAGWAHGMFPSHRFATIYCGGSGTVAANESGTAGGLCDFLALPGSSPAFFTPSWTLATQAFDLEVFVIYERYVL